MTVSNQDRSADGDPTQRFSHRVDDYVRSRPGYPDPLLTLLRRECRLRESSVVADVGSGTGLLAALMLAGGYRVIGVEPNKAMRLAAQRALASFRSFAQMNGRAEATGLATDSIDLITAAQAFHWFELGSARAEFGRVLRPGGWVALIWNERDKVGSRFQIGYQALVERWASDAALAARPYDPPERINAFFAPSSYTVRHRANQQVLDFEHLQGRLLSSSYAPANGEPGHEAMLEDLRGLFDRHQVGGRVTFRYDTRVYLGQLSPVPDTT